MFGFLGAPAGAVVGLIVGVVLDALSETAPPNMADGTPPPGNPSAETDDGGRNDRTQ